MSAVAVAAVAVAALMTVGTVFGALFGIVRYLRSAPPKAPISRSTPGTSPVPWSSPSFGAGLPAPATAAARGRAAHRSFAEAAAGGLWAEPDSPLTLPAGSPAAARDLLTGIANALLMESASAAVRGDEATAKTLAWVEDFVRDACDAIID